MRDISRIPKFSEEFTKIWEENFPDWSLGVITSHKKFQECFGFYANLLKNFKAGNLDTIFYIYNNFQKAKDSTKEKRIEKF